MIIFVWDAGYQVILVVVLNKLVVVMTEKAEPGQNADGRFVFIVVVITKLLAQTSQSVQKDICLIIISAIAVGVKISRAAAKRVVKYATQSLV